MSGCGPLKGALADILPRSIAAQPYGGRTLVQPEAERSNVAQQLLAIPALLWLSRQFAALGAAAPAPSESIWPDETAATDRPTSNDQPGHGLQVEWPKSAVSVEPGTRPAIVLAIDPGSTQSAAVVVDGSDGRVLEHVKLSNEELLVALRHNSSNLTIGVDAAVIEWAKPRGMLASEQLFEALWWAGQFTEAASHGVRTGDPWPVHRLARMAVKIHLCGRANAKDANVRAALIDRYGGIGGRDEAIGRKSAPGPLYGITADQWAALAVAVAWLDGAR